VRLACYESGMRWLVLVTLGLALGSGCKGNGSSVGALRKIDVHEHLGPTSLDFILPLLETQGIDTVVNLSGGRPGHGLEAQLAAAARHPGKVIVFCTPDFNEALRGGAYGERMAHHLETMHALGCRGVKIFKAVGLGHRKADGTLLAIDDPGLDPLFEKAGALGMPVFIHTGDPRAFWQPVTPANERFAELSVHPGWALAGQPVPSWEALLESFERRVARHPKTTFVGLHFGNAAEEPARVDAMLEHNANLLVETSARIPELGRSKPEVLRDIFVRRQDRIMFGTDLAAGESTAELVLGSPSGKPTTPADVTLFFGATWRFFETNDRAFPHPTPIQGDWTIDGIGLPREVLEKVYRKNAARLLHLQ
jgi:predicted TIM-barrel fold metal-dependent hydrolase